MTTMPTPATPALVARTSRVATPSTALLDLLPAGTDPRELCSWVRRGEGMVGWGRALTHEVRGPDRFAEAAAWWRRVCQTAVVRDDVELPGTGPLLFAAMTYAASSDAACTLIVPEVVVGRRGADAWLTTITTDGSLPYAAAPGPTTPPRAPGEVGFADGAKSAADWELAVGTAVERITRGDLDKVVLARSLIARAPAPIDPRWLLHRLADRYDNTWVFAVGGLIGATPEMLVRRDRGLATSRVLAGTIRRTGDDAHDLALAASLARSSKDLEEHEYAVRSVADALGAHCSSMYVPEAPFVLHLANVMHLATDVAGVVEDGSSALDLAASLHPSAAVCGTPTVLADALIAELEGMDRGRYAGPVGWMDRSGDGEWGIALRCGEIAVADPCQVTLYAGCGIVSGSNPEAEVAESDAKLVPMRDALTGG
ncbi:MAG: isochorismate synthase [Tetrasphaera sp.]